MLKIKDNVDLEELKKYGFNMQIYNGVLGYPKYYFKQYGQYQSISVDCNDRQIDIWLGGDTQEILDTLYDMFNDGIIEKVTT